MTVSSRTSGAELPRSEELMKMLNLESPRRAIHFDYLDDHTAVFDALKGLGVISETELGWIENYRTLSLDELIEATEASIKKLSTFIASHPERADLYRNIFTQLSPEDDETKSEAIFVFGASSNARIERAVGLYNEGVADKIIISGNGPVYLKRDLPEAIRMAEFAKGLGVSKHDLILEKASMSLPDNVKRTIDLLEDMNWRPSSMTIISSEFVLTRALMEWYKFCPWDVTIKPVSTYPRSSTFTADGWFEDPSSTLLVLNEYAKLVIETKIDLMLRDGVV